MITLRAIEQNNIDDILRLHIRADQHGYVSTVAESLAQAYVYKDTAFPFAIYHDEIPVGFIMLGYYERKQYYTLWKLLIDEKFQNKGYGKAALLLGIDFLKQKFAADEIYTGVIPENTMARHLYSLVGFAETGIEEDGMIEMRYTCTDKY